MPIHIGGGEFNLDIPALKLWQYKHHSLSYSPPPVPRSNASSGDAGLHQSSLLPFPMISPSCPPPARHGTWGHGTWGWWGGPWSYGDGEDSPSVGEGTLSTLVPTHSQGHFGPHPWRQQKPRRGPPCAMEPSNWTRATELFSFEPMNVLDLWVSQSDCFSFKH